MIMPFENGEEDLEINVEFDYEPFEPMTRHYPGNIEGVEVYHLITIANTDIKLCLLPEGEDILADAILERVKEEKAESEMYSKYGYMMD